MKLVQEHIIFEKFIEDSDPIANMGIGMMKQIKDFIGWFRPSYEPEQYIIACAIKEDRPVQDIHKSSKKYNALIWLQYLLEHKIYTQDTLEKALMNCIWYDAYKSIKIICQYSNIDLNKKMYSNIMFNEDDKRFKKYPLIYAIENSPIKIILTLIKCGAKISVLNNKQLNLIAQHRPALYREIQKIMSKNK